MIFATQVAYGIIVTGYSFTQPNDWGHGSFVKLFPPFTESNPDNTVGDNNFNSPNLWGFDEDQNVAVPLGGLTPDIGAFLVEGAIVASHYLFFDPKTRNESDGYRQEGWVEFDSNVLAVFTSRDSLYATDYLAHTGVTYLNPEQRGLELDDMVWIDGTNPKRVNVEWCACTPGDYVRILTEKSPGGEEVPDSGLTITLMSIGLLILMVAHKVK